MFTKSLSGALSFEPVARDHVLLDHPGVEHEEDKAGIEAAAGLERRLEAGLHRPGAAPARASQAGSG